MARELCAQVSTEIVSVVPQLDDYLCPVCFTVAYWPIRLVCNHIFCSRCIIKLQRRGDDHCPLCRKTVVLKAGIREFPSTMTRIISGSKETDSSSFRQFRQRSQRVSAGELSQRGQGEGTSKRDRATQRDTRRGMGRHKVLSHVRCRTV
jgi:hypothetical protein